MGKDISKALDGWAFDPEQISVRIVRGDDGRDKIQLRLDLGLMQMEFDGRPDGERVEELATWLELLEQRQRTHDAAHPDGPPFVLESEDCLHLLREGVQFYHRYISFWHLARYDLCARDTARNLRLFAFVREFARHQRDKLQFDQWRPYVTMMHTRAVAVPLVETNDLPGALRVIEMGILAIRAFLEEYEQLHQAENCGELVQLIRWRDHLQSRLEGGTENPLKALSAELATAIGEERFEDAARLRDEIRRLSGEPQMPGGGQM